MQKKEGVHILHWLKLDLTEPALHLAVTPPSCAGLRVPLLDRTPFIASMNASFFSRDFKVRGYTVSGGIPWRDTSRVLDSPVFACNKYRRCDIWHKPPPQLPADWFQAAGGVHSLVNVGVARTDAEDAACGAFCTASHPRTAVGLDKHKNLLFWVVVEGRQRNVSGLALSELGALLREQGVFDAINMDGGGSSALLLRDVAQSGRPDNEPEARKIANAWVISSSSIVDWDQLCSAVQVP